MSEENNKEETAEQKLDNLLKEDGSGVDGKAIEEAMVKAAHERAMDPTEMASTAYALYAPHYKKLLARMSTRGLRRVLNYLILFPLEQADINAASEEEKEFMQLCSYLAEAKFVMIMDTYRENAEKLLAAQENALTNEEESAIINEVQQGESNNG